MSPTRDEPLLTVGGVTTAVTALLALLAAFGIPLTEDQQVAILGVAAVVAPVLVAVVARRWVSPAWKVPAVEPETAPTSQATAYPDPDDPRGYQVETGHDGVPDIPRRAANPHGGEH